VPSALLAAEIDHPVAGVHKRLQTFAQSVASLASVPTAPYLLSHPRHN
jgi:hypothetical protein